MSSAVRNNPASSRRTYISTDMYAYQFKTYTTRVVNTRTEGVWGLVTEDFSKCPAGRTLRENGKYLYPMANPGVNQYYVGVYDAISGLSGFIDPNGPMFAEFNTNKPVYLKDNYSDDGSEDNSLGPDYGHPVLTKGIIETVNTLDNTYVRLNPDGTAETTGNVDIGGNLDVVGSTTIGGNLDISGVTTIGAGGSGIARVTTGSIVVGASIGSNQKAEIVVSISGMQAGDMVILQHPVIDRSLLYVGHNTENGQIRIYVYNNWGSTLSFSNTWTYMWFKMN